MRFLRSSTSPARAPKRRGPGLLLVAGSGAALVAVSAATAFGLPNLRGGENVAGGDDPAASVVDRAELGAVGDVMQRLQDRDRPFTATVFGDSTGDEQHEWVYRVFTELAERTDRPLTIHWWSNAIAGYETTETAFPDATGAPIEVFNGSASGKTAGYSLTHFETIAPETSDLAVINHGLNHVRNPASVGPEFSALAGAIENRWGGDVGVVTILENPRFDGWQREYEDVVERVQRWVQTRPAIVVADAHARYVESGDPAALLFDDGLHPNPDGSAVTAGAVLDAIDEATNR